MSSALLASGSVSLSVPGLSAAFEAVGSSLQELYARARAALDAIGAANASISAQVSALGTAQLSIEAVSTASVQAAIDVSLGATLSLTASLPDPAAYFNGLVAGLGQVSGALSADLALPLPSLAAAISVSAVATAGLELEKATILATIAPLSSISLSLSVVLSALSAVAGALAGALAAAAFALARFLDMRATLAVGTMWALTYSGTLSGMGAGLDLAAAASGLPGATPVVVTTQLVRASDGPAVSAQASVLRSS